MTWHHHALIATGITALHYLTPTWQLTAAHPYYGATAAIGVILLATKASRETWSGFAVAALMVAALHKLDTVIQLYKMLNESSPGSLELADAKIRHFSARR